MDLNYTNANGVDIGVITKYNLDWESSTMAEENTFAIDVFLKTNPLDLKYFLYVEDEEIGGLIDSVQIDTSTSKAIYKGRTWRGLLASKILCPDANQDHVIVGGDCHTIITYLINKVGLQGLFETPAASSGITIASYQFYRYVDLYTGLRKMLSDNNAKLKLRWENGKVEISAVPIVNYSNASEISSDMFDFRIQSSKSGVNHMIGLGQGDLRNRQVVHRYIDGNGQISSTQFYSGVDEIVATYDNANCESLDDLISKTEEELLKNSDGSKVEINAKNINADIGDLFTAHDIYTGIVVEQKVTNKIAQISNDIIKYSYKVGDKK